MSPISRFCNSRSWPWLLALHPLDGVLAGVPGAALLEVAAAGLRAQGVVGFGLVAVAVVAEQAGGMPVARCRWQQGMNCRALALRSRERGATDADYAAWMPDASHQ